MCDYSLINVPNRLATEGEELVIHRFPTGSLGFASSSDLCMADVTRARPEGIWSALKKLFDPLPKAEVVPAVCVPPGACLMLQDIPTRLQRELEIGATEEVIFTQLSASEYTYRDAIRFKNGCEMLLQKLSEGQRAKVIDLSSREAFEPPHGRSESVFHYS
jgi:hypothetical protein